MCNNHNPRKIDECMRTLIINLNRAGVKTLACCCGHGKYNQTIITRQDNKNIEYKTGLVINRKKRFYRKDKEGFYYIPEVGE